MADDRSNNLWPTSSSSEELLPMNDDDGNLSIDIETLMGILGETPNETKMEDSPPNDTSLAFSPSYNLEVSDSRPRIVDGSSESSVKSVVPNGVKLESSVQLGSPVHSCSGTLGDWIPIQHHGHLHANKDTISDHAASSSLHVHKGTEQERPNCNEVFKFAVGNFDPLVVNGHASNSDYLNQGLSDMQYVEENKLKVSAVPNMDESSTMKVGFPYNKLFDYPDMYLGTENMMTMVDPTYSTSLFPYDFDFKPMPNSDDEMISMMDEEVELLNEDMGIRNTMIGEAWVGNADKRPLEAQIPNNLGAKKLNAHDYASNYFSLNSGVPFPNSTAALPKKQEFHIKDEKNDQSIGSWNVDYQLVNDVIGRNSSADPGLPSSAGGSNQSYSGSLSSDFSENHGDFAKEEKDIFHESKRLRLGVDDYDGTAFGKRSSVTHDRHLDVKVESSAISQTRRFNPPPFALSKTEREIKPYRPTLNGSHISNIKGQELYDSSSERSSTDDDGDVCILEDLSGPARMNISAVNGKSIVASQRTMIYDSFNSMRMGHIRQKANGERSVFQAALQDLQPPKAEDTPPDGLLAVPLLRHQRIALSWMVKKEKDVSHCSGGILADDQGLGKTISTIALLLKERSPSSIESNVGQSQPETLNLDEDDDETSDVGKLNQGAQFLNGSFLGGKNVSAQGKHRPAAGTLIVCPTSVLRQWSEELHNKVTRKANLSVLVYHGTNRTKDPSELAKFDVVLTTYAIVGMEVPKQPLADEDDDDTKSASGSHMELSSLKRRKYPPSTSTRPLKGKKGHRDEVPGPAPRPLACVGWFRVVLDEAQSIKNHRTQVARACWGLRAKRRWCLSGTPMQNVVDDLYSYFRFLRFEPYSAYKSFCSGIKGPIQKTPSSGYRKLQAVLKTVMLRRTKDTLLDGKPIINLPPKTIKLKKVEFTDEERDFYCRLETESRAQFAEYAAAGTVKQNYVNILLMLLRLRQACDHPLLVRNSGSSSIQKSSVEMAKKLPREKQNHLLSCLGASLAICGICSDPPEDAVVTSCGHVFCNQCICEHLTGDDTHCPTANCKTHLSASLVFSVATLKSCLSDQPTIENNSDCSSIELSKAPEPLSSYSSSKIKAALEVLQSLTKQPNRATKTCPSSVDDGNSIEINLHSAGSCEILHNDESASSEVSSDSVKVVGEKAIVFSQWTRMLDLLEDCLKDSSIQYRRLDGTMSVVARDKAVKDFNNNPEVTVIIMSLKAASLGLNMVAACHVLLLDLWWNPTTEDQAIDRAHRIGQTRPVTVLRLTVKDTVEDRILALQQRKREMVASAFGEDENGSRQTRLTVEDLSYLFMDG